MINELEIKLKTIEADLFNNDTDNDTYQLVCDALEIVRKLKAKSNKDK